MTVNQRPFYLTLGALVRGMRAEPVRKPSRCRAPLAGIWCALILVWSPASGQTTSPPHSLTVDPRARITIQDAAADGAWALPGFEQMRLLRNGGFAVASETDIHQFDSLGRHIAAIGRKGEGPGEFNQISGFAECSLRTFVVSDWVQRRLTLLPPPPAKARVSQFPQRDVTNALVPLACEGGQIEFIDHTSDPNRPGSWPRRTLRQDTMLLLRSTEAMARRDTLARVPGISLFDGLQQPFGAVGQFAFNARSFAYGISSDSVFQFLPRSGGPGRSVTVRGLPLVPITVQMRAERVAQAEKATPPSIWARALKDLYATVPWPSQLPLWDKVILDDRSRLWVREYRSPLVADSTPARWHVADAAIGWRGILILSANDDLLAVRGNDAIILHRADDDTESLQVRRVRGL